MFETIWFILWMLLWAVYFVLDGFDLGLGTLLPFLGKTEQDKRIIYACAGPFWDGNEVWLIAAGGVTFAAFPKAYAVMFSALYAPLLILLFALILRAVSFEFRDKVESSLWRGIWDFIHFFANCIPAVLLGVAFANLFMGIPIDAKGVYHGTLLELLNPYGLCGGLFFLLVFILHGALWLIIKSEDQLQLRAIATANFLWPLVLLFLVLFLFLTKRYTHLFDNYVSNPALFALPLLACAGLIGTRLMLSAGKPWFAWMCHALFIIGVTFFGVSGLYPGIILSSMDPTATVTIMNGSSSELTLKIMLGVVLVMVPIVIAYQVFMYRLFAAPVTAKDVENAHY
ncbi:MAG: cytochrome d ubiquinol oxidase subunit II [Desulfovibrio sp.]|nr:cytochrome d ubiquinol oxidase subunit II [Desulfovibrio sp.]